MLYVKHYSWCTYKESMPAGEAFRTYLQPAEPYDNDLDVTNYILHQLIQVCEVLIDNLEPEKQQVVMECLGYIPAPSEGKNL